MNSPVYIARSTRVAFRILDGEAVIMSSPESSLFTLNETATVLWQSADGVTPLDEIVSQKLCAAFEVASETALADARELAEKLAQHGILILSSFPIPIRATGQAAR
ncbi:MAG TPA: PqqD family protein [Candidatus Acidoferrales bacterium]|nr:PqqD family protein [Candidatus Acidoferrales bacterium]